MQHEGVPRNASVEQATGGLPQADTQNSLALTSSLLLVHILPSSSRGTLPYHLARVAVYGAIALIIADPRSHEMKMATT